MDFWSKVIWCCFIISFFSVLLTRTAFAVTIASQENNYSANLDVWQAMQELGANLSGKLESFTFRVRTERSNLNQFDNTALNTRIYDKSNNSYVVACVPSGNNKLLGLTFNTSGVPQGYEDVTIDFSCRNYQFIPGHKYLIVIANANMGNSGTGIMLFAAASYLGTNEDLFPDGGLRYGNGNRYDYGNNVGICNPVAYNFGGTSPYRNGCYVWGNSKNDLYFILKNNAPSPPPPRLPVVFIPGIGGSEFKASQDIFWSDKDNGHGGKFSYAYKLDEKIWVNQEKAVELGDDDYFDVLRLKPDGQTPEVALSLTGNLTSFGYGEIDSFFTGMGYEKGKNFFVFPYDWRKDVRTTKDDLDNLIEQAKTKSGQTKVNLVVHSLGGLIARYYISDSQKASKVNKLIELGVPHLGAVYALKTLMYGDSISYRFKFFEFPIIPSSEIKDLVQNYPSILSLLPSNQYFNFYNNLDQNLPYPYRDDRDINSDKITGALNYPQTKNLLSNLSYNMTAFGLGEQLHSSLDPVLNQTNGVKVYEIVGTAQPTLGQIQETWWVSWPVNLIPKTEEIFINGDDTVPLYSASLKNDSLDLSGAERIYYVEQKHSDLVSSNGTAMQTVKSILNDDNTIPVEVKSLKIDLEGEQLSLDDGELELYDDEGKHTGIKESREIEENIPDTFYTTSGKTKHAFVKKKAKKIVVKTTRKKPTTSAKTTNLKIRTYRKDKISKTTIYKSLPLAQTSKLEFNLDPSSDISPTLVFFPDETKPDSLSITPTSEVSGDNASDQTAPQTSIQISGTKDSSGIYTSPVTVTLSGKDDSSGILKIEYSLDNGSTVQTYSDPFIISTPGKTTLQVKSIDKSGNEEIPQTQTIEIAASPSPIPTPTLIPSAIPASLSNSQTSNSGNTTISDPSTPSVPPVTADKTPQPLLSSSASEVLGINFDNPSHISDEINVSKILDNNLTIQQSNNLSATQILGGLLIVSGGIVAVASLGFALTFIHPTPK